MTGTGIKDDPYIPETWDEFVTAVGTSDAYVKLPEGGGVYDLNEINPEGNFTLQINCTEIQGNEWEIRNAYNMRVSVYACVILNLHFLNFYWEKSSESEVFVDGIYRYCKFSGIISGHNQSVFISGRDNSYCSINVKFVGESYELNYSDGGFNFCNISLNHADSQIPVLLSVSVHGENSLVNHVSNGHNKIYLDGRLCVLCSDLGNVIADSSGNQIDVTDEQLRDAAYLNSIGFPIVQ